jgi:hypothetical protein
MILDYLIMWRRTLSKNHFSYSYFYQFFGTPSIFEVNSVATQTHTPCSFIEPNKCALYFRQSWQVRQPNRLVPTAARLKPATGSHAVIGFCDRSQAIWDTTAHIHYENMDKRIRTNPKHCHIIWTAVLLL